MQYFQKLWGRFLMRRSCQKTLSTLDPGSRIQDPPQTLFQSTTVPTSKIISLKHISATDLRGCWPWTGGAGTLQPGLGQTPAAVPEVGLEAGDGGLTPDDHHVVHSVLRGQRPPPGNVKLPDQYYVSNNRLNQSELRNKHQGLFRILKLPLVQIG